MRISARFLFGGTIKTSAIKMPNECFFVLALTFLGASTAPVSSTATVAANVGPTVSETIITPYHRIDAISTPCGQSVARTTAIPVAPYGISAGAGFLGTAGVFPGIVGNGFTGNGVGTYPGIVAGHLMEKADIGGIGHHQGVIGTGIYPGVGGVGGAGIFAGGMDEYPHGNFS